MNRLGSILTSQVKQESTDEITVVDVERAIDILLQENNDHFNNLFQKVVLYQETFKKILKEHVTYIPDDLSQSFLWQYGLIKSLNKQAVVANPIYQKRYSHLISKQSKPLKHSKKKIFICYSHEDKAWLDKLVSFLTPLKHENIDFWFDDNIQTGDNWSLSIQDAIQTAHMTICLVSPKFLNSEFIRTREIPAIKNRQNEGMVVFPIIIEDCLWNVISWLKNMQIYPKNKIPMDELNEKEQSKKFMKIVSDISEILVK